MWKPKLFEKRKSYSKRKTCFGIRKCYRCGDPSHKANKCTFGEKNREEILIRKKWLRKENSLNYLLVECYNIFGSAKASIVKPIAKWVNKVF